MRNAVSMGLRRCASAGAYAAVLAVLLCAGSVQAQDEGTQRDFDIPAGDLVQAVNRYSRQSDLQVVYDHALLAGKHAPAVSGRLAPGEALDRVLADSGLAWEFVDDGTVVLRAAPAPAPAPARPPAADAPEPVPAAAEEDAQDMERLLVVGSRLGASEYESAQPVVMISREEIERSGATTIAHLLLARPEVSVANRGDSSQGAGNFNAATVQLRGLPVGNTLVLVNGRRIGNSAVQGQLDFFDLNTLPLALVDRIEILPVGSSAIYGGDALAGVVNIVLRKDASGLDVTARHSFADGYEENHAAVTWGQSWERGTLSVTGTWTKNTELSHSERALTADKDFTRFGGSDNRSLVTNPGNVFSLDGCPPAPASCFSVPRDSRGNLPGLDSPYAAVPVGSDGIGLTPEDFIETAGTLHRESADLPFYLPAERYGLLVSGSFDVTPNFSLFTELTWTRNDIKRAGTALSLFGETGSFRVPAHNPFNPFGVEVGVNFAMPGRPPATLRSEYLRALLGAQGSFGAWEWELSAWRSRNEADQVNLFDVTAAVHAALASSDPATALNPFQDGPGGPEALIASFYDGTMNMFKSGMWGANGFIRGTLWELPAGDLEVVLGGEHERQEIIYITNLQTGAGRTGERDKHALFGEFRAPILANRSDSAAASMLTLTGALRADRDSSFAGTGTTETLGLEFRPLTSLLLRASHSTAFKPPNLYQVAGTPTFQITTVTDPRYDDLIVPGVILTSSGSGVPDTIRPERGRANTAGLVFSPQRLPVNVELTWWENKIHDRIAPPPAAPTGGQFLVDHEADFPGRVIRDPVTDMIVEIDGRPININFVDTAGVDLGFNGRFDTRAGTFYPNLAASYTYRYDTQVSATSPLVNGVSEAFAAGFAPRWKGTVQMGWERGNMFTQLTGRYTSSYRDYFPLTSGPDAGTYQQLGDIWFFDLSANYALGRSLYPDSRWLSGMALGLSAVNLFNRLPDFSASAAGSGYDPSQYDIRGRFLSAQLKFSF